MILPHEIRTRQAEHPLTRHLHPTHIGAVTKALTSIDRPDGTDTCILIMCTDGCGFVETPSGRRAVPAGNLLVIPAFEPHSYGAGVDQFWSLDWVHFSGTLAYDYFEQISKSTFVRPMQEQVAVRAKLIFGELHSTLLRGFHDSNQILATQQLAHLLGVLFFSPASFQGGSRPMVAETAIAFMNDYIDGQLTLQEIADELGYSKTHFSALFKKETGYPPIDYFIHMKISRACKLLDSTNLRIGEIGEKIGVPNPYYFSRLFTKTMGIPPRRYRALPKG